MKAGRDLDALVAEKVMGMNQFPHEPLDSMGMCHRCFRPAGLGDALPKSCDPPHYSTDITAAWEVVEKLDLLGEWELWRHTDPYTKEPKWIVGRADYEQGETYAVADTAPLVLCLAALKAVGA
jgi:hypothetical protein